MFGDDWGKDDTDCAKFVFGVTAFVDLVGRCGDEVDKGEVEAASFGLRFTGFAFL